jgi:hypothetical protein
MRVIRAPRRHSKDCNTEPTPELAGSHCRAAGVRDRHPVGHRCASSARAVCPGTPDTDLAVTDRAAVVHAAHGVADGHRHARLVAVHVHLCHVGGEEPARRNGVDSDPRCTAIGTDFGISILYRSVLRLAVSGQNVGSGAGRDVCDLHQPSLEHGFQLLPVAAFDPRPGGASGIWKFRSPCRA